MFRLVSHLIHDEDGVLSFEWAMLVTLLTIGIVTGLAAARDAIVDELGDAAQAMGAVDDSFRIDFPLRLTIGGVEIGGASDSEYTDYVNFDDSSRGGLGTPTQGPVSDNPS